MEIMPKIHLNNIGKLINRYIYNNINNKVIKPKILDKNLGVFIHSN